MNIIETNLEFNGLTKRNSTNRIILHNSGVSVLQSVEVIHNYHKNSLGWAGIGYHFYVRKDGSVYRGRPEDTVGAHAYGSNSDSIGICFEGNFDEETMPEAQKRAGIELIAYLKEKYGISLVQGHRDVCNTSCPGKNFPFEEITKGQTIEEKKEEEEFEVKRYKNGSTKEYVYQTTECVNGDEIGYLNPGEECECYGITNNCAIVVYKIDGSSVGEKKVGFVKWLGGVK